MEAHKYERPWQVMPVKIINLALDHAEKDDDFEHQIAFLLLDIGVEAALKVYLINKKHDVEKILFPELLKRVKEELSKENSNFIQQIEDIAYFHGIRNKLYHQGDGIRPTKDNLKRYSDIGKKIVEEVLNVNIKTEEKEYMLYVNGYEHKHKFEELIDVIENNFKFLQESSAIISEKLRPKYGTREFALQLKYILHSWPEDEGGDPRDRIQNQMRRLEKFNELTGNKIEDYDFVDFVLNDINHLFVRIALQETSDNLTYDWREYKRINNSRSTLLRAWKQDVDLGQLTDKQILEEYKKNLSWLESQEEKLGVWIDSHTENIDRSHVAGSYLFEIF